MPTPYKVFLSAADDPTSAVYLNAARTAVWRMDQMMISALSASDIAAPNDDRMLLTKQIMDTTALFIGVYGREYGVIPSGAAISYAEQEYRLAYQRGIVCAVFLSEDSKTSADPRLLHFKQLLETRHIVRYFDTAASLQAQIILAIDNFLHTSRQMRLLPPSQQSLRPDEASLPVVKRAASVPNDLETLVDEGMRFAADDIEQIMRRVLQVWDAQKHVPAAVVDSADACLIVNPLFGVPAEQSQFRSDVFMLMPFREPYNSIYQTIIRPVIGSLNLTIRRGDEFSSVNNVVINDVWAAINGCKLVLADITEVNANVFYELGIAHTLGKPTLLLTQATDADAVPFDVRHLRYTRYTNTIEGGEVLAKDLQQAIIWILNDIQERQQS